MASRVKVTKIVDGKNSFLKEFSLIPDDGEKVMIMDGRKYRLKEEMTKKDGHCGRVVFTEFDEKKYDADLDSVVEYLLSNSGVTAQDILKDVLRKVSLKELDKIKRQVVKKDKVKIKKGCLSLKLGKTEICIID